MSQINLLLNQIDELNNKIEEEKSFSYKRKIQIDFEIKEIEEEIKRAGFKHNLSTIVKCNKKIDKLEKDKKFDYIKQYKSDIEKCKNKIIYIIFDYYKKGIYIQDIIKLENISQNISSKWLTTSNFGENTGFLFVEEKGNLNPCCYYANPITDIKVSSPNLVKLIIQIKEINEELLIFNEGLANKSYDKAYKSYRIKINNKLENLKSYQYRNPSDIFNYFTTNSMKFSKEQLVKLCEIMINNPFLNKHGKDFIYVIDSNQDKLDSNFIKETYTEIINQILLQFLTFEDVQDIFIELKSYLDIISEKQAKKFCYLLIKYEEKFVFTDDFEDIFEYIKNKFNKDLSELEKILSISLCLKHLKSKFYNDFDIKEIIEFFRENANCFTINQINRFCKISIEKIYEYRYYKCIDSIIYILNTNKSKINEDLYNESFKKLSIP